MRTLLPLAAFASLALTGCSLTPTAPLTPQPAAAMQGSVYGGQQPINGAHVYLMQAATTGYGAASVSLLNASATQQSDSVGAYVTTNARGFFSINGDYTCTAGTQVYLLVLQGDAGGGNNPASGEMAIFGQCPSSSTFAGALPFLQINEVTTVAAAYAFAGFATDATHVASSGTALAQTGIANAFINSASLASLSTGTALATTPSGNGTVPQAEINTLANILAACINSTGQSTGACGTLFAAATADGTSTGTQPTETATAIINIAHHPGAATATLYGIPLATPPFSPALTAAPKNFTIALKFTTGTTSVVALAIDAAGNVWSGNSSGSGGYLTELSPNGTLLAGAAGYGTEPNGYQFEVTQIDPAGNIWMPQLDGSALFEFSSSGALLSPATGYTGGGLSNALALAVDGSGNQWVANGNAGNLIEFSNAGSPLGTVAGPTSDPGAIAIDGLGNVWSAGYLGSAASRYSPSGQNGATFNAGGLSGTLNIAIDSANSAWIVDETNVVKISFANTYLSGSSGFTTAANGPIAIDGTGHAFIANKQKGTLTTLNNDGTVYTGAAAYAPGSLNTLSVDGSGNLWAQPYPAGPNVLEFIGIASPVVTPMSVASRNNTLGTRP